MKKSANLIFIFFFINLSSGLLALAMEPEQSGKEISTQQKLNLKTPEFRGLENVNIYAIIPCCSTIKGERWKTHIYVGGVRHSLIYRGNLQRFRPGNQVSIIYENIELHGRIQRWIHLIHATDLNTLVNRWKHGECCCKFEQEY